MVPIGVQLIFGFTLVPLPLGEVLMHAGIDALTCPYF